MHHSFNPMHIARSDRRSILSSSSSPPCPWHRISNVLYTVYLRPIHQPNNGTYRSSPRHSMKKRCGRCLMSPTTTATASSQYKQMSDHIGYQWSSFVVVIHLKTKAYKLWQYWHWQSLTTNYYDVMLCIPVGCLVHHIVFMDMYDADTRKTSHTPATTTAATIANHRFN